VNTRTGTPGPNAEVVAAARDAFQFLEDAANAVVEVDDGLWVTREHRFANGEVWVQLDWRTRAAFVLVRGFGDPTRARFYERHLVDYVEDHADLDAQAVDALRTLRRQNGFDAMRRQLAGYARALKVALPAMTQRRSPEQDW
jgi:hypothetical protein